MNKVKMKVLIISVVFATLLSLSLQSQLPSDFKKCKRSDEDFNGCLKTAIQDALPKFAKGLPQFKYPAIDPIQVPKLTVGEGTKGAVRVVQHFSNVKIYNFTHTKINKVEAVIHPKDFSLDIYGDIPEFIWECEYEFNGQILVLPIFGKGQLLAKSSSIGVHVSLKGESDDKKGKTYGKINSVKIDLTPVDFHFDVKNLFNGDERLGTEMNNLLNENWKELWLDMKPNYETVFESLLLKDVKGIFDKVSLEDIFPV